MNIAGFGINIKKNNKIKVTKALQTPTEKREKHTGSKNAQACVDKRAVDA